MSKVRDFFVVGTFKDGTSKSVSLTEILTNNWNQFTGWHCNAGQDIIYIDKEFTVWSCNMKNQNLGNLFDKNFKLPTQPMQCTRHKCAEKPYDIAATKTKEIKK